MIRSSTFVAFGFVASGFALSASMPSGERPEVGEVAPEISGKLWLNHLGDAPNLVSLRGRVVLLEFWATY